MSDNLSTTQIVNMFCNMTGVDMNDTQKEALTRLLEGIYDSGVKSGEKTESVCGPQDLGPSTHEAMQKKMIEDKCDGCKTQGPSLDMEEADLELFVGPGRYCQFCRMSHIDKMLERIDPELDEALDRLGVDP